MAWKSPSTKKKRPPSLEQSSLERLAHTRRLRAPFSALTRKLIRGTLERYLPEAGSALEIGAGDGQLYDYLPEALRPRLLLSEPSAAASRSFRQAHPAQRVLQASAEALPLADDDLSAVLGLCVLDVVSDGAAVARELHRVLAPGGRVFHFLDMSTRLHAIIDDLAKTSWVPLPNVFSDPATSSWPEDLFVAPLGELQLVASVLARHGHPMAQPLARYLELIRKPASSGNASELAQLQDSSALRGALRGMFRAAFELAEPELRPQLAGFQGRPLSSARHFAERLVVWFGPEAGFEVEVLDVLTDWALGPRQPASAVTYISSTVGERRELDSRPESTLCADAPEPDKDQILQELGILVLVARKAA